MNYIPVLLAFANLLIRIHTDRTEEFCMG